MASVQPVVDAQPATTTTSPTPAPTPAPAATPARGAVGALFGVLLLVDSLHFVFARAFVPYLDPVVSAGLVLLVATVQIGLYGWWRGQLHWQTLRAHAWFFGAIGFLVGASTALGYASVNYIDAGTASMLSKTSTLFSIVIGLIWLREKMRPVQLLGSLLALVGVALVSFQPGDYLRLGSLLVLGSTTMYAIHAALVKRYGDNITFVDFFFGRLFFTTATLLLLALGRPINWAAPTYIWLLLIVAGTVDVVISRSLYYLALRRMTVSLHAIVLTLSPVATVLWSLVLFDTFPAPLQLIGGAVVIVGVAIAALFHSP